MSCWIHNHHNNRLSSSTTMGRCHDKTPNFCQSNKTKGFISTSHFRFHLLPAVTNCMWCDNQYPLRCILIKEKYWWRKWPRWVLVLAYCLYGASIYLNQCRLIIETNAYSSTIRPVEENICIQSVTDGSRKLLLQNWVVTSEGQCLICHIYVIYLNIDILFRPNAEEMTALYLGYIPFCIAHSRIAYHPYQLKA